MKVDRTTTYGAFAACVDGQVLPAARAAAENAAKQAAAFGRVPVQVEVTIRVAPEEKQ